MSVRKCLSSAGLITGALFLLQGNALAEQADLCANSHDLRLINGKIVTMDKQNSIVSEVTIQESRFAVVGKLGNQKLLGSMEPGKLGDLVVLSEDFIDPKRFRMKRLDTCNPS